MSNGAIVYHKTAERPDIKFWITDAAGNLIDFTGYTFAFKVGKFLGQAAAFTKTFGITGAAGAGVSPSGTPNIVISFTAGELDSLTADTYKWQLRATSGGLDRVYQGTFTLVDVLT